MRKHDTSGHEKRVGEQVTNSMRQGDDTASNPGHGKAMDNVRRSGTPGVNKSYMPQTHDQDRVAGVHNDEENDEGMC